MHQFFSAVEMTTIYIMYKYIICINKYILNFERIEEYISFAIKLDIYKLFFTDSRSFGGK